MQYKIKKGDKFLCLEDYVMEEGEIAYTKDVIYLSELDDKITDNQLDVDHGMYGQDDFFTYFKPL